MIPTLAALESLRGALSIAALLLLLAAATSVRAASEFPPHCQMPSGWTVPTYGATAGWSVATDSVRSGACSLKSDPIGNVSRAQIQYSADFPAAGMVSWANRISSESGHDHLKFSLDGIEYDIGSGEVPWSTVSIPITKGTHTLRWSFEKDEFGSSGNDAAWIDDVVLPANHSTGPLPVPGPPTLIYVGSTTATFEYSPPLDDGGSPIIGYVARWRFLDTFDFLGEWHAQSLPSPFDIPNLGAGTYEVYLSAINANGEGQAGFTVAVIKASCGGAPSLFSGATASVDFAPQPINTTSGAQGVSAQIGIESSFVNVSMAIVMGDFTIVSPPTCEGLFGGELCMIDIAFSPRTTGANWGLLQIDGTGTTLRCNGETGSNSETVFVPIFGEGLALDQTIAFDPLANKIYADPPFSLSATASSGLAVTLESLTTAVCAVSGSTATIVGAGTCTIAASQAGDASYNPAPQVLQTFAVAKANQAITFATLGSETYGDVPFLVAAISTSGLAVTFTSATNAVCSVLGGTVSIVAAGTCTVDANQPGNANYNPAPQVSQSFTVAKASQSITFGALGNGTIGDAPFAVSATASSNLAVVFSSLTTSTCTVSGATVTLAAVGTCTIAADQSGNANYLAAPQVTRSFQIGALGTFALTVTKAGSGAGTVTSNVAGVNCDPTCSFNFTSGTVVTLSAVAANDSVFSGWSGACTGTSICQVTMNSAMAVTATFTLTTYALTVTKAGSGTGTITSDVAGINCGATCAFNFTSGTVVTLSAAAANDSMFAGWSGACTGTSACTVTVDSAKAVTATFNANLIGNLVVRYRLFSPGTLEHLYTTDFNEYSVLPVCCAWNAEGAIYKLFSGPGSFNGVAATPYYRLYNPASFQHHWTTDFGEYTFLATVGWQQEGTDGYILPTPVAGAVPLYRLYISVFGGLHLWTIDLNEANYLTANAGWVNEGIAGYVIPLP